MTQVELDARVREQKEAEKANKLKYRGIAYISHATKFWCLVSSEDQLIQLVVLNQNLNRLRNRWWESSTSVSDLAPLGVGLYGDTLRRLDGGIDHKILVKKFWTFRE